VVSSDMTPKEALDAVVLSLNSALETCSAEGKACFEALLKDLKVLQRRSVRDNGLVEDLNNSDVLGQVKNLTMNTRYDIPALNLHFTKLYEEAKNPKAVTGQSDEFAVPNSTFSFGSDTTNPF